MSTTKESSALIKSFLIQHLRAALAAAEESHPVEMYVQLRRIVEVGRIGSLAKTAPDAIATGRAPSPFGYVDGDERTWMFRHQYPINLVGKYLRELIVQVDLPDSKQAISAPSGLVDCIVNAYVREWPRMAEGEMFTAEMRERGWNYWPTGGQGMAVMMLRTAVDLVDGRGRPKGEDEPLRNRTVRLSDGDWEFLQAQPGGASDYVRGLIAAVRQAFEDGRAEASASHE